jgi:hypothetical protein
VPLANTNARLLTFGLDSLPKSEIFAVVAIEGGVCLLVGAQEVIAAFQAIRMQKPFVALQSIVGLRPHRSNVESKDEACASQISSYPQLPHLIGLIGRAGIDSDEIIDARPSAGDGVISGLMRH